MIDLSTRKFPKSPNHSSTIISFGVGVLVAAVIGELFERSISWSTGTLIGATVILILVSVYSVADERRRIDSLLDGLENAVPRLSKGNKFEQAGFNDIGRDRSKLDFSSFWNDAVGCIKVIGFSANDILSPHISHLIANRLREDSTFKVQVLIINPWSTMAQRRSESVAYKTQREFYRLTWSILLETKDKLEALEQSGIHKERFEVRLYDAIPSLSMIIDDQQALVTPITYASKGGSSPYFTVDSVDIPNSIYQLYVAHFDSIWCADNTLSLNKLDIGKGYEDTIALEQNRVNSLPSDLKEWLSQRTVGNHSIQS